MSCWNIIETDETEMDATTTIPSQAVKITIPPQRNPVQQSRTDKAPEPSRVQPTRRNKASRMAEILDRMEQDDDGTTSLPERRKKWRLEDDPEDFSTIPADAEQNPMAPAKMHKRNQEMAVPPPAMPIPTPLPLQPVLPQQVPPSRQAKSPNPRDSKIVPDSGRVSPKLYRATLINLSPKPNLSTRSKRRCRHCQVINRLSYR
jgi:hypothetical protein